MICSIIWDPPREVFSWDIPLLGRPILWYGLLFALGFFLAYIALRVALRASFPRQRADLLSEKFAFYAIVGAVVGARLGDLLFYQHWHLLWRDPLSIVRVWEGGLASHGGAAGMLVALWLFTRKYKELSWLQAVDLLVVPASLAGGFIRIGNFMNQEILGIPTALAWGVLFVHPADGSVAVARHPVQIYEAIYYFALFGLLYRLILRKTPFVQVPGHLTALFLLLLFGFRFFIEFFKEEQSVYLAGGLGLTMGQYLSLPFIGLGVFLLFRKKLQNRAQNSKK